MGQRSGDQERAVECSHWEVFTGAISSEWSGEEPECRWLSRDEKVDSAA